MVEFRIYGFLGGPDCSMLSRIMGELRRNWDNNTLNIDPIRTVGFFVWGNGSISKPRAKKGLLRVTFVSPTFIEATVSIDCSSLDNSCDVRGKLYSYLEDGLERICKRLSDQCSSDDLIALKKWFHTLLSDIASKNSECPQSAAMDEIDALSRFFESGSEEGD
jgi:hypothetical protein